MKLATAVAEGVGNRAKFMVDANHCYTTSDALYVGHALEELGAYWFEEPVAPEDLEDTVNFAKGCAKHLWWRSGVQPLELAQAS